MCKIALELIAERLKHPPIPVYLLELLAMVREERIGSKIVLCFTAKPVWKSHVCNDVLA